MARSMSIVFPQHLQAIPRTDPEAPTTKAVQTKLVDTAYGVGVLPVILDQVDEIEGGKQASEC